MKFGWYYLSEYVNMLNVSAVATTMFLGGWHAPWPLSHVEFLNSGWWGMLWFFLKIWFFMFLHDLDARHPAALPLRPVHEPRLEAPHPHRPGLARAGRPGARHHPVRGAAQPRPLRRLRRPLRDRPGDHLARPTSPSPRRSPHAEREYTGFEDGFPVPPLPGQTPVASPRGLATIEGELAPAAAIDSPKESTDE